MVLAGDRVVTLRSPASHCSQQFERNKKKANKETVPAEEKVSGAKLTI